MTQRCIVVLLLLVFIASCDMPSAKDDKKTYSIGYMICNSEEETLYRFRPMTAYLSKKLGVNFEAIALDTADFPKHIDKLDFTHSNSLLYIIMNRNNGLEALAAEKVGSLGSRTRGAIVALKKSGVKSLKDLKGKSMIFGPAFAPAGYMSQFDLLLRSGIVPEKDLSFYTIPPGTFKHEKVIYGVLFEKYDAGAFPLLDFEKMIKEGRIDRDDFIVLAEGETIPYCNFGVTQRVDDSLAKRFKKALFDMKKDDTVEINGEVIRVLERAGVDGYEDIKDKNFDILRDMAKRTNMPPYQRY